MKRLKQINGKLQRLKSPRPYKPTSGSKVLDQKIPFRQVSFQWSHSETYSKDLKIIATWTEMGLVRVLHERFRNMEKSK